MGSKKHFEDTLVTAVPPPAEPEPPPPGPVPEVEVGVALVEAVYNPPKGHFVSSETRARIIDLARDAVRTDPGGVGQLGAQILADLGV